MRPRRNAPAILATAGWLALAVTPVAAADTPTAPTATPSRITTPDGGYGRPTQPAAAWARDPRPLLWNFRNCYQPCVIERPVEPYPYRMWFFGWAKTDGNQDKGTPGCDAIFHARSNDLQTWEVWAGNGQWDTAMDPGRWAPVVVAADRLYDAWHNGDPSVVFHDGRYYMAFSATGKPGYGRSHPNDMLLCVMGATSEDGIVWRKTSQPLIIEPTAAQDPPTKEGWTGDYHRPSLMWDQGRWRLWFDYWHPTQGLCLGYAENLGDFAAPGAFHVLNSGTDPLIANWPNPEVVKVGNHYLSFADPVGYPPMMSDPDAGWRGRALCEATSDDGLHWRIVGFIAPDPDAAACHVPQAFVRQGADGPWLYLFYATQRGGTPVYDYRYDRIRAMRRRLPAPPPP